MSARDLAKLAARIKKKLLARFPLVENERILKECIGFFVTDAKMKTLNGLLTKHKALINGFPHKKVNNISQDISTYLNEHIGFEYISISFYSYLLAQIEAKKIISKFQVLKYLTTKPLTKSQLLRERTKTSSDKVLIICSQERVGVYRCGRLPVKFALTITGILLGAVVGIILATGSVIAFIIGGAIGGFFSYQIAESSVQERFFVPIDEITNMAFEGDVLSLYFNDSKSICIYARSDSEESRVLFELLSLLRTCKFTGKARPDMEKGYDFLERKNIDQALSCFSKALHIEQFHPGPNLMRYLTLVHIGKGEEAVKELIVASQKVFYFAKCSERITSIPESILNNYFLLFTDLWSEGRFSTAQMYYLAELLGIESPLEELNRYQLAFAALLASRLEEWEQAVNLLEVAIQREKSPVLKEKLFIFGSRILSSGKATEFPKVTRLLEKASKIEKVLGKSEKLSTKQQDLGEIQERSYKNFSYFYLVFEYYRYQLDNRRKTQIAWNSLRADRLNKAQQAIGAKPYFFYEQVSGGYLAKEPAVWLSALTATELLLKSGDKVQARSLIESAYYLISPTIEDAINPYLCNASALLGLYSAVADSYGAQCRLYLEVFQDLEDFGWVNKLVTDLMPDIFTSLGSPLESKQALLAQFTHWLEQKVSHSSLKNSPDVSRAIGKFEEVRRMKEVSVVVGGETSAGKSTFINALLGVEVLHTSQEEATAIPTHIVYGSSWSATVHQKDGTVEVYSEEGFGDLKKLGEFVRQHSYLGSQDSNLATKLVIEAPISSLGQDVELVDTPGLNAYQERTDKTEDIIEFAHACIFVIDARNALKAGEMRKIIWATEAVGKTIFVVNKVDLIEVDDDLDCDDNALEEVLKRVKYELCQALNVAEVNLFAVSSLPGNQVHLNVECADSISDVRQKLQELLDGSRDKLTLYAATKVAHLSAKTALNHVLNEITIYEKEFSKLSSGMPEEPKTFQEYIHPRILKAWPTVRDQYKNHINDYLKSSSEKLKVKIRKGVDNSKNDNETLKRFIRSGIMEIVNDFISEIESKRNQEWELAGSLLLQHSADFFRVLYRDIEFENQLDPDRLLHLSSPLPLVNRMGTLISTTEKKLQEANQETLGVAATGATVGFLIGGPVGGVIGGVIGSLSAEGITSGKIKEIKAQMEAEVEDILCNVLFFIQSDWKSSNTQELPPLLQAIFNNVEEERERFESLVKERIKFVKASLARAKQAAQEERRLAVESSEWASKFGAFYGQGKRI